MYVERGDCSRLAENTGWQVQAVQQALLAESFQPLPSVTPVLCFVDGDWPLLFPPEEFKGVRLEGMRSMKRLLVASQVLEPEAVSRMHHSLPKPFPPTYVVSDALVELHLARLRP